MIRLIIGILGLALTVLLILLGRTVYQQTPRGHGLAVLSFSLWWYTLAAFIGISSTTFLIDFVWRPDFIVRLTEVHVNILIGTMSLFFLTYYFTYLILGHTKLWAGLATFYVVGTISLIYLINHQRPIGVTIEAGRSNLVYAAELPEFHFIRRLMALLFIPPLVGLASYVSLLTRTPLRVQKTRILCVTLTILLVFGSIIPTRILLSPPSILLEIALMLGTILVTFILLMTYRTTDRPVNRPEATPA
jgi:hypothetical protein